MGNHKIENITLTLPGTFQVENASLAIASTFVLGQRFDIPIKEDLIKKGVRICKWPGRFEVVKKRSKTYILDGAHNIDSILALARSMKRIFPTKKAVTIFGISREKELEPILQVLSRFSKLLIITQSSHPRAQTAKRIAETGKETNCRLTMVPASDIREAMDYVRRIAGNKELILVTGSLFLVGEARRMLRL